MSYIDLLQELGRARRALEDLTAGAPGARTKDLLMKRDAITASMNRVTDERVRLDRLDLMSPFPAWTRSPRSWERWPRPRRTSPGPWPWRTRPPPCWARCSPRRPARGRCWPPRPVTPSGSRPSATRTTSNWPPPRCCSTGRCRSRRTTSRSPATPSTTSTSSWSDEDRALRGHRRDRRRRGGYPRRRRPAAAHLGRRSRHRRRAGEVFVSRQHRRHARHRAGRQRGALLVSGVRGADARHRDGGDGLPGAPGRGLRLRHQLPGRSPHRGHAALLPRRAVVLGAPAGAALRARGRRGEPLAIGAAAGGPGCARRDGRRYRTGRQWLGLPPPRLGAPGFPRLPQRLRRGRRRSRAVRASRRPESGGAPLPRRRGVRHRVRPRRSRSDHAARLHLRVPCARRGPRRTRRSVLRRSAQRDGTVGPRSDHAGRHLWLPDRKPGPLPAWPTPADRPGSEPMRRPLSCLLLAVTALGTATCCPSLFLTVTKGDPSPLLGLPAPKPAAIPLVMPAHLQNRFDVLSRTTPAPKYDDFEDLYSGPRGLTSILALAQIKKDFGDPSSPDLLMPEEAVPACVLCTGNKCRALLLRAPPFAPDPPPTLPIPGKPAQQRTVVVSQAVSEANDTNRGCLFVVGV